MKQEKKRPAQSKNEAQDIMTFNFAESQTEIRSILVENEPWLVAKDICDALDIQRTNDALKKLDKDEKLMRKLSASGQNRKMWLVSESGLYALIMRSNKPEAKSFRKWVTSEVLPAIRKKGYYKNPNKPKDSFIDARAIPYHTTEINNYNVRYICIENQNYFSVADLSRAIQVSTGTNQTAKKLNAIQTLAKKIWIFGNTHPSWFTTELGSKLLISGSRKLRRTQAVQLVLPLNTKEVPNV